MKHHLFGLIAAGVALLGPGLAPAAADAVEDFYKGSTVTLIVPFSPGGTTASQAEIIGKHLAPYIPGKPAIRLEFMPGAGGMLAVNHAYNTSPRDGSVLIYAQDANVVQQYLDPDAVKYDVRDFNWLGSVVAFDYVLAVAKASGVTDVEGLKANEVAIASTGVGSASYILPTLTNAVLGTKMKVVPGYPGSPEVYLALERGEVKGYLTQQWFSNIRIFNEFTPVMTYGAERNPNFPDAPTLRELVTDPADLEVIKFIGLMGSLGRGVAAMPETPKDRVDALRKAFADMAADPAVIAELKTVGTGEDVRQTPLSGEDMQARIVDGLNVSEDVIKRARDILKKPE